MMMRASARSLPAVKMSCTLVAHLTLEQFTHVSSTKNTKTEFLGKELAAMMQLQIHVYKCLYVHDLSCASTLFAAAKCTRLTWAWTDVDDNGLGLCHGPSGSGHEGAIK